MGKKTIKISEVQLNEAIKRVLDENVALELPALDSEEYNQIMCMNEMAQINKQERGRAKDGYFNSSLYRVYVIGEGGYQKFPHFHITMPSEGWDIRMNMNGSFHSIKFKSANRQNDEDFQDIERIAKKWVTLPNANFPKMTNGEAALFLWNSMN